MGLPVNPNSLNIPDDSQFLISSQADTSFVYFRTMAEVKFKTTATGTQVDALLSKYGAQIVGGSALSSTYVIRYSDPGPTWAAVNGRIANIAAEPPVLTATPMTRYEGQPITYGRYPSDGQNLTRSNWTGTIPSDTTWALRAVRAPEAWGCENGKYGGPRVKVGIFEWDFDAGHPDLAGSKTAPIFNARVSGGVQLTQGSVDGLAFHGTADAGMMSATGDNGQGVAGMMWNTDLRLYNLGTSSVMVPFGTKHSFEQALQQAIADGIQVLSLSIGLSTDADTLRGPIQQARLVDDLRTFLTSDQNALVVMAAGNGNVRGMTAQSVASTRGPAALEAALMTLRLENVNYANRILIVAGTGRAGGLWEDARGGSNFYVGGATDIAAPAESVAILGSRVPGYPFSGAVHLSNGTSISAPMVAGAAAQLLSMQPALSPAEVKNYLLRGAQGPRYEPATGQLIDSLSLRVPGYPVYQLDAYGSLRLLARERVGTPVCGFPVSAVQYAAGTGYIRLERSPSLRDSFPVASTRNYGVGDPSVAQGGRLISFTDNPGTGLVRDIYSTRLTGGSWTTSGPATGAFFSNVIDREYLEKDTAYIKHVAGDVRVMSGDGFTLTIKRAGGTAAGPINLCISNPPPSWTYVNNCFWSTSPAGDYYSTGIEWTISLQGPCVQRFHLNPVSGAPSTMLRELPFSCGDNSVTPVAAWAQDGQRFLEALVKYGTPTATDFLYFVQGPSGWNSQSTPSLSQRVVPSMAFIDGSRAIRAKEIPEGSPCEITIRGATSLILGSSTQEPECDNTWVLPNGVLARPGSGSGLIQQRQAAMHKRLLTRSN